MHELAFFALFLLVLSGLIVVMQLWGAHAFGWSSLARAYRFSGMFSGQVWRQNQCRVVRMRWAGFEASLNAFFPNLPQDLPDEMFGSENLELDIGGNPEGLYVAVQSRLVFGHPPLFIPWSDVAISTERVNWTSHWTPHWRSVITGRGVRTEGGFGDCHCLLFRFRKASGVLLQLSEEESRLLIAAAGSSWPGLLRSQSIPTAS